jgi:simple sugar transport system permease protein
MIIDGFSYSLPLFIIAIGGIYSERSGITNLALEGLLGFGAFTGGLAAVITSGYFDPDSNAPMVFAFIAAAVGGGIFAMLHALLCIKFRANQVISGVVINILAVAITAFLTSEINDAFFGARSNKFQLGVSPRITVPGISEIPVLGAVFKNFYPFEVLILVLFAVCWYVLYRTPFGMHLRACGDNPQAVDAAGISVARTRLFAVITSGMLSGIGGMCFAYSIMTAFSPSIYFGAGFLAIAALIFGNWKIVPTFGACLLFGFARSGAYLLANLLKVDSNVANLAMSIPYILTLLLLAFFAKSNRAPRALGEIYDKSKR